MAKNDIYKLITTTYRKDGRYMKRISINGKLVPIYGHTHKEVVDKYIFIKEKQKENNLKINAYTFKKWTEKYLQLYKTRIQDTTMNNYKSQLKNHIYPKIGAMKIDRIKQYDILEIIQEMENKGITKTQNEALILIKDILDKAIDNDLIYKNVAKNIQIKRHKSKEKEIIPSEVINCLNSHSGENETAFMILFLIYTGMRRGEITALTKDDIDLDHRIIRINKSAKFPHNQPVIKSTKNEETRYIPILNIIYDKLVKHLENKKDYVFTTVAGKPMTAVCLKRKIESINKLLNAEINKQKKQEAEKNNDEFEKKDYSITLHQTRHTYASFLHDAGIDVKQAQLWTGHKDIRVLLDIYTHLDKNQNEFAIEKLNTFLA